MKRKFAFIPKVVNTWIPRKSKAIIWMQKYYQNDNENYCMYLGLFSYEL
jgi:hypothetical protein